MGPPMPATPPTSSTIPMIFSHLALDFLGSGDFMAVRTTVLARVGELLWGAACAPLACSDRDGAGWGV